MERGERGQWNLERCSRKDKSGRAKRRGARRRNESMFVLIAVRGIAAIGDGRIVTASRDKSLKIWLEGKEEGEEEGKPASYVYKDAKQLTGYVAVAHPSHSLIIISLPTLHALSAVVPKLNSCLFTCRHEYHVASCSYLPPSNEDPNGNWT
eukprot:50235-Hanusia_phi.AAC.1